MKMGYLVSVVVLIGSLACAVPAAAVPPAGEKAHFTHSPAVKSADEHTVVLEWDTNIASDSRVTWGPTPESVNKQVEGSNGATHHLVTIGDLQPGTTYYFKAASGDDVSCGVRSFTTMKPGQKPLPPHTAPVVVKCVSETPKK